MADEKTTALTLPENIVEQGSLMAKALVKVVSLKKKPVIIKGEQYLEFEDWQTIGRFMYLAVKTGDAQLVEINSISGAKAKADVIDIHTGIIVGGAEAYCMSDEENWQDKPWFQLASMAQTRAGSKALRNQLAWIVVLAGYRTTPAEEMLTEAKTETKSKGHWCAEHQVVFFKKGKMKSYAHPIGDTGEWCHEHIEPTPEAKPEPSNAPQSNSTPPQEETNGVVPSLPSLKNAGELLMRCKENNISRAEAFEILSISSVTEIADLDEAWAKIVDHLKKNPK